MTEVELTEADKTRIRADIRVTTLLNLLFFLALTVFMGLLMGLGVGVLTLLFGSGPTSGFGSRVVMSLIALVLVFTLMYCPVLFKWLDLLKDRKVSFKSWDYQIGQSKIGPHLLIKVPRKIKFELHEEMVPLLDISKPITIEMTKISKTLLLLSQDDQNLLEKAEKEINEK